MLLGIRENQPGAKFYFDEETGLLARLVRYGESPLGVNSSQIDYADYREVNGVQVPFRVTVSNPKGNLTTQFEQIRQNVAIDPERFARPSADHASTSAAPALKPGQVPKQP